MSGDVERLVGRRLAGRYELVELIGHGGMGQVYRGVHLGTGGPVAVKLIAVETEEDDAVVRLRQEAALTARLAHPNTVRIFDSGDTDGLHYLVLEYVPGRDLTAYLRVGGQQQPFAAHVIYQIACSLAEAHGRGLVHRDVKPSNIRVQAHTGLSCFVRLIDWGIARTVAGMRESEIGVIGTLGYIAPEQIHEDGIIDPRTDLYALGCVAYELLSGRLPYAGITHESAPVAILKAHLQATPVPLARVWTDVHPRLASVVMSMLHADQDARPQTAYHLLSELKRVGEELAGGGDQAVLSAAPPVVLPPIPEAPEVPDLSQLPVTAFYGDAPPEEGPPRTEAFEPPGPSDGAPAPAPMAGDEKLAAWFSALDTGGEATGAAPGLKVVDAPRAARPTQRPSGPGPALRPGALSTPSAVASEPSWTDALREEIELSARSGESAGRSLRGLPTNAAMIAAVAALVGAAVWFGVF